MLVQYGLQTEHVSARPSWTPSSQLWRPQPLSRVQLPRIVNAAAAAAAAAEQLSSCLLTAIPFSYNTCSLQQNAFHIGLFHRPTFDSSE